MKIQSTGRRLWPAVKSTNLGDHDTRSTSTDREDRSVLNAKPAVTLRNVPKALSKLFKDFAALFGIAEALENDDLTAVKPGYPVDVSEHRHRPNIAFSVPFAAPEPQVAGTEFEFPSDSSKEHNSAEVEISSCTIFSNVSRPRECLSHRLESPGSLQDATDLLAQRSSAFLAPDSVPPPAF